jgi:hypothetical protein
MKLVSKVEPGPFGQNSYRSTRTKLVFLAALCSMVVPAVAGGFRFPSTRASQSPDGKWKVVCESPKKGDENSNHRLVLKRTGKTASTELHSFDRGCDVLWSPDSSHGALTDWLGSNISDVFIYSVTNSVTSISLQELFPNGTIPETELRAHCYFEATRWLDHNRLSIRIFGHTDEVHSHDFEYSYIFHVSTRDFEKAKGSGQKTPTRETPNHRQTSRTLVFDPVFRMTSPILLSVQSPPPVSKLCPAASSLNTVHSPSFPNFHSEDHKPHRSNYLGSAMLGQRRDRFERAEFHVQLVRY